MHYKKLNYINVKSNFKKIITFDNYISVNQYYHYFISLDISQRNNRLLALRALKTDGYLLEFLPFKFRNDISMVKEGIKNKGYSFIYASEELKDNEELLLLAIQNSDSHKIISFSSNRLRDNEKIILSAITKSKSNYTKNPLRYASERLKADKHFMLKAIEESFSSIAFATEELKKDEDILRVFQKFINMSYQKASFIARNKTLYNNIINLLKIYDEQNILNEKITYIKYHNNIKF
jgi:hypothetical protein